MSWPGVPANAAKYIIQETQCPQPDTAPTSTHWRQPTDDCRLSVEPLNRHFVRRVDGGLSQHARAGVDEGVWRMGRDQHEVANAGLDRDTGDGVARLAFM